MITEKPSLQHCFGFDPEESAHHFVVTIPRVRESKVDISEHLSWDPETGSSAVTYGSRQDGQIRVVLPRAKWDMVADELRTRFNLRLRRMGRKSGNWKAGYNLVRRELGQELVLLAWAIEEADPGLIPAAVANWKGLEPEERWWLYTQTAAATGHGVNDRGIGWRRALRYGLTENPVLDRLSAQTGVPEFFQRAAGPLFQMGAGDPNEEDES